MDAYIIYARRGKFETLVRIQPSVLGVYTVEFSLRDECTEHLKDRVQGIKSFISLRREKLAFGRDGCRTTYTRDVSGFDHPIHVNVMKRNPKE